MKKLFLFSLLILSLITALPTRASEYEVYPVRLYLFYLDTCPHCHEEIKFLEQEVIEKYPQLEISKYEVSKDIKNKSFFSNLVKHYGLEGTVPTNIIGDKTIVGFDKPSGIGAEIEKRIQECSANACQSWIDDKLSKSKIEKKKRVELDQDVIEAIKQFETEREQPGDQGKKPSVVNVLGVRWDISGEESILGLGALLGLADGINPCMFSVILFLLTYLLAIGSKKRAVKAGIAFIITTFVVYFLFMLSVIQVVDILHITPWLRIAVILFALVAGLIMIKDYFYYGQGVSLEISDRFKPRIESLVKKGTVPSAIVLALFSSLVELPCTSGLPLAYVTIIHDNGLASVGYLVWYNLFFVIPLVVIVTMVLFAWTRVEHIEAWRERFKKYMRLVSGLLLLLLAFALWKNYI